MLSVGSITTPSGAMPWALFTPNLVKNGPGPLVTAVETTLLGKPLLVRVALGGILGLGLFDYSTDGGVTFTLGLTLGASVLLGGLGVTLNFAAGTYVLGTTYSGSI